MTNTPSRTRPTLIVAGILVVALFLGETASGSTTKAPAAATWADVLDATVHPPWNKAELRAFDFWIGEWEMNWRNRPKGEFYHVDEGNWMHHRVFPILGGKAIVELAWTRSDPEKASQRGFSIRYFDEKNARWVMAQNWPNAKSVGSAFVDQLVGKERHGRLAMYSATLRRLPDGTLKREHRRYNFADIRPGSFRWDGSNTPNRGDTWTTWMIVDAHRRRDLDAFRPAAKAWPGFHEDKLCKKAPHGAFDSIEGQWTGRVERPSGGRAPAEMTAGRLLDGCGVVAVVHAEGVRAFVTFGYNERFSRWVSYRLDDQPGTIHTYAVAKTGGEGASFEAAPDLVIKDEFTFFQEKAHYETGAALTRTLWKKLAQDEVVFEAQNRSTPEKPWTRAARYTLTRRQP